MKQSHLSFFVFILFFASSIKAQQGYSGNAVLDCDHQRTAPPSPSYLYTCNGPSLSCRAFLIFKSQPSYNSIKSVCGLLNSNPSELARINDVSDSYTFPTNKEVIVPVNCSCSGQYYQANTTYVIGNNDTYYSLATVQYQGLSSCSALIGENPYEAENLEGGLDLLVPLRCACPTRKQTKNGIKYLLTYSLYENDSISDLSERFNVSDQKTASANGLTGQDPVVYPLTTVLIPLPREPQSSQTIIYNPIDYTPPPQISPVPTAKRSYTKLHAGIGAGVASLIILFLLVTVLLWLRKKKMIRIKGKNEQVLSQDFLKAMSRIDHTLKVFQVEELKEATKDFSPECKIQGSVYKGTVGKSMFAIKKISRDVTQEVNILHKLNHVNLITLCGIGTGEEHCYLVYEYMENGSLKDWLQDPSRSGLWNWTQRVQIALDIANGLDYLHNFTYPPYVHKDFTSSNVLLNSKLRAKITNFSLARSADLRKVGFTMTKNVEGTLGYMAPEYLESGIITPKLDVYAFGVVVSELITGQDTINEHQGREELLSETMISIVDGENAEQELTKFMEMTVRSISPIGLVLELAKLCVACLTEDPGRRPSMHQVVSVLTKIQSDSQMWALAYQ